jgi:ABC-type uncharacterized transport system YnjBCD substrate-binding protein
MLTLSKPDVAADGTTRYQQLTQKLERLECSIVSMQKGLIQQESYLTGKFEEIDSRFISLEKLNESLRFTFVLFALFVRFLFVLCFIFLD